ERFRHQWAGVTWTVPSVRPEAAAVRRTLNASPLRAVPVSTQAASSRVESRMAKWLARAGSRYQPATVSIESSLWKRWPAPPRSVRARGGRRSSLSVIRRIGGGRFTLRSTPCTRAVSWPFSVRPDARLPASALSLPPVPQPDRASADAEAIMGKAKRYMATSSNEPRATLASRRSRDKNGGPGPARALDGPAPLPYRPGHDRHHHGQQQRRRPPRPRGLCDLGRDAALLQVAGERAADRDRRAPDPLVAAAPRPAGHCLAALGGDPR